MINNNFFKDRSFQRYLVLDILNNPEGQRKAKEKREREREVEIDPQKRDRILAFAHARKTDKLFNYVRLVEKYAFFLAKFIFSYFYTN